MQLSAKIEAGSASPTTDTPSLTTSQPSPSPSLSSGHHECRNALKPTVDNFLRVPKDDVDLSDDEFSAEGSVEGTFRKVFAQNAFPQFLGKSSVIVLLQQALNMQVEYTGMKLPLSQCVFDLPGKTQLFSDICGDTSRDYPVSVFDLSEGRAYRRNTPSGSTRRHRSPTPPIASPKPTLCAACWTYSSSTRTSIYLSYTVARLRTAFGTNFTCGTKASARQFSWSVPSARASLRIQGCYRTAQLMAFRPDGSILNAFNPFDELWTYSHLRCTTYKCLV